MLNLTEQWGWAGNGRGTDLEKLLEQMVDESDPQLPFGYIKLDEVLMQICLSSFRSLIRLESNDNDLLKFYILTRLAIIIFLYYVTR